MGIRGASGAVGTAAVDLARYFGAKGRVIVGTASTASGKEVVSRRGGIPTGHGEEDIRKAVDNGQYDVILELMGNQNLGSDINLVAPGGRIAVIGSRPGGGLVSVDARQLLVKEATVRGVFLWNMTAAERDVAYADISEAFRRIGNHRLCNALLCMMLARL